MARSDRRIFNKKTNRKANPRVNRNSDQPVQKKINKQVVKRLYRKEPISSFLIVVGLLELVIGGVDGEWSLFSLGLGLVLGAVFVRWSQIRKRRREVEKILPRRYLPPSDGSQPLPYLDLANDEQRR